MTPQQRIARRWVHARLPLKNPQVIQVVTNLPGAEGLLEVLRYFKNCGEVGHLATLKDGDFIAGFFDGDGEARIDSITVNGVADEKTAKEGSSGA